MVREHLCPAKHQETADKCRRHTQCAWRPLPPSRMWKNASEDDITVSQQATILSIYTACALPGERSSMRRSGHFHVRTCPLAGVCRPRPGTGRSDAQTGFLQSLAGARGAALFYPKSAHAAKFKITDVRLSQVRLIKDVGTVPRRVGVTGGGLPISIGGFTITEVHTDQGLIGIGPGIEPGVLRRGEGSARRPGSVRHQSARGRAVRAAAHGWGAPVGDRALGPAGQDRRPAALQAVGRPAGSHLCRMRRCGASARLKSAPKWPHG